MIHRDQTFLDVVDSKDSSFEAASCDYEARVPSHRDHPASVLSCMHMNIDNSQPLEDPDVE